MNKSAEQQKWNYDKWLAGRTFVIGDSACLHYVQRKKERNAKLGCLSEGPYIVISVLSNGAYRSRKAERSFKQIKALPGTLTKRMDSIKADAVVEPERRGKRDIFTFRR